MTATIADLIRLFDRQVHDLGTPSERDTANAHVAGWMKLAAATRRTMSLLPLGGRSAQVMAGLRTVLDPLVHGPRDPLVNPIPAPSLVRTSRTIGAIADVLAEHLQGGGRREQIGTEAIKLEASVLSDVHVIARWSRAVTASQRFPGTTGQFPAQLDDLIVVTEPFALVPRERRASVLEGLRLPNATAPGLEGAVTPWAAEATLILQERYRVSGWAMQAIAGNLALLSHTAGQSVNRAVVEGEITTSQAGDLAGWFAEAARLWRTAAAWPPHIRLGGQTPILRHLGQDVRQACTSTVSGVDELGAPMTAATRLSLLHASTMDRLAANNELWMHTSRTNYRGDEIEAWTRQPPGTTDSWRLVHAARDAHNVLERAVTQLIQATRAGAHLPEGWPREQRVDPVLSRHGPARPHAPQSPLFDVGR
ncbi:hypothetical protein [Micropruina sonneratiae]|uniref:hypothetical protein n=1 Tax=Micropruina sonneratiae TaxID=2986940 RepID=UPI0022263373|nr:hypothetical protein [Micropruina sp. KQZ13P-5]MCW3159464.1 hypothetical protein [Micropruina sp. KQZ13P-5]